jgi:seryl-tRNA synthetase
MSVKKFLKKVFKSLNMDSFEFNGKKKSLKTLLNKLKKRRVKILKQLKTEKKKKIVDELQEECDLLNMHIKNGKKKFNELKKKV